MLIAIAVLVIVMVWDFAQNGGGMTNALIGRIIQLANSYGF